MSQVVPIIRGEFPARCPQCTHELDLLSAPWCGCMESHPSKLCPNCDLCACSHPDYGNPICWEEAPPPLRRFGFARLFSIYTVGIARTDEREEKVLQGA